VTWEYQSITVPAEDAGESQFGVGDQHIRELDGMGLEGWELVSAFPIKSDDILADVVYLFKRQCSNVHAKSVE
jgi:hypothetical protein